MSLRWRIALGLALIAAIVSAVVVTGAYLTVSNQLTNSIDESLLGRVQLLEGGRFGPRPGDPDNEAFGDRRCPPPGSVQPAAAVQLIGADGSVLVCIAGAPDLPVSSADRALRRVTAVVRTYAP